MIPTTTIDILEATWRSLTELGATLTEQQWKLPTDLPEWTVQDNLSHLVGIERMLEGMSPTEHRTDRLGHVRNPIGEMNEHEVDVRRDLPGADVQREWEAIAAQRIATLRGADDAYFAQETMTPTGPGTIADFLHIRVLDCWVHEQDMRRAVGIPGNLDTPAAAHTVDRLLRTLPIVVGKRAATPEGGVVVLDITGPVERRVVTRVDGGRAGVLTGDDADAAARDALATVRMDTEAFTVLATGRRTADALADRIVLDGDTKLARRVVDHLNMMI